MVALIAKMALSGWLVLGLAALAAMQPPWPTLIQRCFLDDEGLGPVVGVAQPVHLDADVRDVRILGAITSIRVLRKIGLQTPLSVIAARLIRVALNLHGEFVVPANDDRDSLIGLKIGVLSRAS
jgi:hypothetical protein